MALKLHPLGMDTMQLEILREPAVAGMRARNLHGFTMDIHLVCADILVQRNLEIHVCEVFIARFATAGVILDSCYQIQGSWVLLAALDSLFALLLLP